MTVSMDGESEPAAFRATSSSEVTPAFSPDGRWLAYASDEARGEFSLLQDLDARGRFDVYVRPFPEGEPAYRISSNGGTEPLWSPDGTQLFYLREREDRTCNVMVVDVQTDATFSRNRPRTLFEGLVVDCALTYNSYYDVAPDGQRFVMRLPSQIEAQPVTRINIVLNWVEELKRLVPPP